MPTGLEKVIWPHFSYSLVNNKPPRTSWPQAAAFSICESVICTILLHHEGGREGTLQHDVLHVIVMRRVMSQDALKSPFGANGLLLT